MSQKIIRTNQELFDNYHQLGPGDIVAVRVRMRPGEEHLLTDLTSRGVTLIPSGLSQALSRSKAFQSRILGQFMFPGTATIYNSHDLMDLITAYGRKKVKEVICKLDRANGGMGILKFSSIEDIYNQATLNNLPFPFTVQPYVADCLDYRAVILGDTVDTYQRHNPYNFRHNLHCGGENHRATLSANQLDLCKEIMTRGDFPYAHIDFLVNPEGNTLLSEINLRGGLRGSTNLTQNDYLTKTGQIHETLISTMTEK
ncbi:MAG: hypothetical protein OEM02_04695 [Desulfobulbaceae bacterium]|nr:hypothetical protein [Desulfobulbaceae bacterium]